MFLFSTAWAYNADDYYRAGLQLYNAKDYTKAIQYFSASLNADPQKTAAYQARGNCYYASGQYANALMDYQQIQKRSPSPQLDQFIQTIQMKLNSSPQPILASQSAAPADSYGALFEQGKTQFRQKQYAEAVQSYEAALRQDHSDYALYYYLGLAYQMAGNLKYSAVAIGIANQMKPSPEMGSYVQKSKEKILPEERTWVDAQLAASAGGKAMVFHTKLPGETDYALRLKTGIIFLNMPDLQAEGQAGQTYSLQQQLTDSSVDYNAQLPFLGANIGFEPAVNLAPNFELGFPIAVIPAGTFTERFQNSTTTISRAFGITAFTFGVDLRMITGNGPFRVHFSGGPMIVPVTMSYTETVDSVPVSGSFTGLGLGAQVQLGFDVYLDKAFAFGPFISYAFANVSSFTGTIVDNTNNINTTGQLYTLQYGTWPLLQVLTPGQAVPAGALPTQLDLGGLVPGIQFAAFF